MTGLTFRKTTAQVLDEVPEELLEKLLQRGLIPPSLIKYRDIFYYYDTVIRVLKKTPTDAVFLTAGKFDVSIMTVYRAIKVMK